MILLMRFLFFMLLSAANLGVASDFADRFRQSALSFIVKSEMKGLTQVEGLNLGELKKSVQEVEIVYDSRFTFRVGNRRCAMWQPRTENVNVVGASKRITVPPRIFLNETCTKLSVVEMEPLATHEILGAMFNIDRQYEITTQILSASSHEPISPEQLQWQSNRRINRSQHQGNGGSTGVGGGGDYDDLRFKIAGLQSLKLLAGSSDTLFGIPVKMLREAIFYMKVAPAADIDSIMEFHKMGSHFGREYAVLLIQSPYYRNNHSDLGLLALYAARLFVTYSPLELGFIEEPEQAEKFTVQQLKQLKGEILAQNRFAREAFAFETAHVRKVNKP